MFKNIVQITPLYMLQINLKELLLKEQHLIYQTLIQNLNLHSKKRRPRVICSLLTHQLLKQLLGTLTKLMIQV